jgi:cytochrome c oxidase subunit 4
MSEHIVSTRVYFTIYALLMALTATTVAVSFADLGKVNDIAALTIAVTKAVLVILYFMHVRYGNRFTGLVVASGFAWLALLILLTLADELTRGWLVGSP